MSTDKMGDATRRRREAGGSRRGKPKAGRTRSLPPCPHCGNPLTRKQVARLLASLSVGAPKQFSAEELDRRRKQMESLNLIRKAKQNLQVNAANTDLTPETRERFQAIGSGVDLAQKILEGGGGAGGRKRVAPKRRKAPNEMELSDRLGAGDADQARRVNAEPVRKRRSR